MADAATSSYQYSFETTVSSPALFNYLLAVKDWWSGLYGEEIVGNSQQLHDEFTFKAGDGVHYSKQRLVKLEPDQISWLVIDSNLSFLKKTDEWTGTEFGFIITANGPKNVVTFTHKGLVPTFECYNGCAGAWTQYLENLAKRLG